VRLMDYSRFHARYEQAIAYGERILEIDPLREEIHRELMQIYAQMGQRPKAVQQYETCRARLMTELGIVPMPETRKLHSEIVKDEPILSKTPNYSTQQDQTLHFQTQALLPAEETTSPIDLELVFNHTTSAMNKLEETRRDIQNIYYLLQRLQRRP
jgi:DNA-binding SARP family transcriptional activator